jgi:hypothetical protein
MRALASCVCLIVTTLLVSNAGVARADTECARGYRDTTADERAAMTAVLERVRATLPPAPIGWQAAGDESLDVPTAICRDDADRPWAFGLYRDYQRVDDVERRDRMLEDVAKRYAADMQAKQPRIDAINVRIQELTMAAVAAAGKADYGKVDDLNDEIATAQLELEQVMAEGGTFERLDAASAEAARDMNMRIEVSVNPGYASPGYGAQVASRPGGAVHAWHRQDGDDVTALILFGDWRTAGSSLEPEARAGVAPTAVQTILVRVTADTARIGMLLEAINFATLATLIGR